MDDPWGSPWATDSAPKIEDLSEAPPLPVVPATRTSDLQRDSPKQDALWQSGELWGGWGDSAARAGSASPGWRESPAPEEKTGEDEKLQLSGQWNTLADAGLADGFGGEAIADSAISFGGRPGDEDLQHDGNYKLELSTSNAVSLARRGVLPPADESSAAATPAEEPVQDADPDQRPGLSQEPSKVQELVEMYDTIARQSPIAVSPIGTSPKGMGDAASAIHVESSDRDTPTDIPDVKGIQSKSERDTDAIHTSRPSIHSDKSATDMHEVLEAKAVDESLINAIFPSTDAEFAEPEPMPDNIIDDTFTNGSERKAWYLMSRPGSIRKYDLSSDDDRYIHITWAKSRVRDETLKIVRRWMEEDSVAGRVVWGRKDKAVGAHMFNWDSKEPYVEIRELLRRNQREKRASTGSEAKSEAQTRTALGWGDSLPASPVTAEITQEVRQDEQTTASETTKPPQPKPTGGVTSNRPKSWHHTLMITQPGSNQQANGRIQQAAEDDHKNDEDDDDDWGEMVLSPSAAGFNLQPTETVQHTLDAIAKETKPETPASPRDRERAQEASAQSSPNRNQPPAEAEAEVNTSRGSSGDWTAAGDEHQHSQSTPDSSPALSKLSSFDLPPRTASNTDAFATKDSIKGAQNDADDDAIVTEILRNLPDLSYMFQ